MQKVNFFAWLDSDDEWIKKKLEIQIDYMLMNNLIGFDDRFSFNK